MAQESVSYQSQACGVSSSWSLKISSSRLEDAGTGLFTLDDIPAGADVCVVPKPVVNCVDNEALPFTCDWCFFYSKSSIHPSGRFYEGDETRRGLATCSRCKVVNYCSKDCQVKAWTQRHKFECKTLAAYPKLATVARLLFRLLNSHRQNLFTPQQWASIQNLENHLENHLQGENGKAISDVCRAAKVFSRSELDHEAIQKLFSQILTNSMIMVSPAGDSLGLSLEPYTSLINHSCDPNVLLFFEGIELRVRSLRPIVAGEELTHAYVSVDQDSLTRQEDIRSRYFFTCKCHRCEKDMSERLEDPVSKAVRRRRSIERAKRRKLERMKARADYVISDGDLTDMEEPENSASALSNPGSSDQQTSGDVTPMKMILDLLNRGVDNQEILEKSLQYAIKNGPSTLNSRFGPGLVHSLFNLVQVFAIILTCFDSATWKDQFPTDTDMWNVLHGYLDRLTETSTLVYGQNTSYTKAIRAWFEETQENADGPTFESPEFQANFDRSLEMLVQWANKSSNQTSTVARMPFNV